MSNRKYTVSEIERMRSAIEWSYPSLTPYMADKRSAEIEARLRTHMQNGTSPEELEAWSEERQEADQKRYA